MEDFSRCSNNVPVESVCFLLGGGNPRQFGRCGEGNKAGFLAEGSWERVEWFICAHILKSVSFVASADFTVSRFRRGVEKSDTESVKTPSIFKPCSVPRCLRP